MDVSQPILRPEKRPGDNAAPAEVSVRKPKFRRPWTSASRNATVLVAAAALSVVFAAAASTANAVGAQPSPAVAESQR